MIFALLRSTVLQQEEADEITLKVKIQFKFSYGWLQAFEE
jgi:hypothetical protein